ncbi:MAG: efflux RND transporter periplasmic adaptor subunit [Candidatus Coatesbacteria bacterium]
MKRLRNRRVLIAAVVAAVVVVFVAVVMWGRPGKAGSGSSRPVRAVVGSFRMTVQEAGTVQPLNKVQILPPVGGRIDRILVREGAYVKRGQILAWMSSSDRAVLLDNARAKGEAEVKYWEEAYQPTPIIAPAEGLIIARNVVEGQTVSTGTGLYDLSDRLIVEAAVDETDLGKIRLEQRAEITVDAYPDKPFSAHVSLIEHQAVKVNNVVSYTVQLDPDRTPGVLRAGMTANVNFILSEMKNVLLLPAYAVKGAEKTTVTLRVVAGRRGKPEVRQVALGPTDGALVVVTDGLKEGEGVLVDGLKLGPGAASSPVLGMPSRRPGGQGQGGGGGGGRSRGGGDR